MYLSIFVSVATLNAIGVVYAILSTIAVAYTIK